MTAIAEITLSPEDQFRALMRASIDLRLSREARSRYAMMVRAVMDHRERERSLELALEIVGCELEAYDA